MKPVPQTRNFSPLMFLVEHTSQDQNRQRPTSSKILGSSEKSGVLRMEITTMSCLQTPEPDFITIKSDIEGALITYAGDAQVPNFFLNQSIMIYQSTFSIQGL